MVERTDLQLVAPLLITSDPLVLLRMVKPLDHSVALPALQTLRTRVPPMTVLQHVAVLRRIAEEHGRSPKVSHVVGVDAAFRIVAVFLGRAPARLIVEHEKGVTIFVRQEIGQVLVQQLELQ